MDSGGMRMVLSVGEGFHQMFFKSRAAPIAIAVKLNHAFGEVDIIKTFGREYVGEEFLITTSRKQCIERKTVSGHHAAEIVGKGALIDSGEELAELLTVPIS